MNHPRVTLISITNDIPGTMRTVWEVAKGKVDLSEMRDYTIAEIDNILSADLPTSEFINMIWCVEGMPRAFWDQFDRSRHAAFWEQSVRILDLTTFADNMEYWEPGSLENNSNARLEYNMCMMDIQEAYKKMLKLGIPSEDARGVLPLHINVRGTCCINLRALKALISNRICFIAQGSYWLPVVHGMMLELAKVLPPKTLRSMANLPCYKKSTCPIESNVVTRLTNEDPNPVCPIYLKRFAQKPEEAKAFTYAKHPEYDKIKEQYYELIRSLGMDE